MFIYCSCPFREEFNKKDDIKDYQRAGWKIIGWNIRENQPYYLCKTCQEKKKKIVIPPFRKEIIKDIDTEEESLYIKA